MTETTFGVNEARALLEEVFAPWVVAMELEPLELGGRVARFRLPASEALQLKGGPGKGALCGQAIAAVADTASVLALSGLNGRFRICTTVAMNVNFLRPIGPGPVEIAVQVESNGRALAATEVRLAAEASGKTAALATLGFMYLED
ncbi:Acyl-coenzyme A thioesterase PaaI, contains HGG motif [Meinhardsimonia xiamenensis]|jgi:acyl-coenzyme A thioesterase PaaI-like protein|uniref:Acyl-coenzyme A thioesterase PaaI, contains HGG motif n=1 Tax=Meinhardsimonia xiamenensis TaxID=990712 RepID=A0A1G9FHA1_9RHOB|nr:PaaI family thioesterase [Meinhardsimonia xiamenensis]PRX37846.1 acyl-coenzyme A thioesterase PaaI-like protein [Meinhardsimonia xiamenensis]SDK87759.1 Acyl-coenzyme A thioesterase PaaI, contains HGG motif [Meinhardsimonia xiamenensis]